MTLQLDEHRAPSAPAVSAGVPEAMAGKWLFPKGQRLARWHEHALYLSAHPFAILFGKLVRRGGPFVRIPGLGYVINDPDLVRAVLGDPERFSKTGPGAASTLLTPVLGPTALVNMEGPAHREIRERLRGLLTARFVAELVDRVFAQPLAQVRARLKAGQEIDLARLAQILTGRIMCASLGITLPPGREDEACVRIYRLVTELGSVVTIGGKRLSSRELSFAKGRFAELTREAAASYTHGDETTVLGRLRAAGLSFEESKGIVGILLLAGTETTATAMPRLVALLHDTDQWRVVRQQRELLRGAIDEGLRLTVPLPLNTRSVVHDTELDGHHLRANERIVLFTYNAMRSPKHFDHPEDFDIRRVQPRLYQNLWFGHGPHFCLGFALAHRELETVLGCLLDAGELRIVRRRYARRALFAGYSELHVACQ